MPDEIQSLIARIDRLTERVRGSGGGLPLFHDLERAVGELEERARLYLDSLPIRKRGDAVSRSGRRSG